MTSRASTHRRRSVAIIGTRGYPSYYGGFETLVRHLAPHLADEGWDVTVYSREGQTVEAEADPRVTTKYTQGINSRSFSTLSYGLTASLSAAVHKPDVALVMNVANGYFLPALRARGIPVVLNVDGLEWERDKWSPAGKKVFRMGASMSARFADELIADSTNIAEYWKRELHRDSVFIPYGGYVDDSLIDGSPAEHLSGLEPGNFVLAVARLVPENSIDVFLEAASLLPEDTHVVLVGSAPAGDPLQQQAEELMRDRKNVHLLGHVKNDAFLNWLWTNAGVYYHGQSVGGTNPALVQAMACGATIVARDTVFNREVLGDAGLFASPEPEEVVAQIDVVMPDSTCREKYGILAQHRGELLYTWDSVLRGYQDVLHRVLTDSLSGAAKDGH